MKKTFLGSILVGLGLLLSSTALAQSSAVELKSISVPSTMVSGHVRLGNVQLNEVTGSDVVVDLSSTAGATVNSSVTVPAGAMGANFPIHAAAVSATTDVTISAALNTTTMSAKLQVIPASLADFIVTQYVIGGTNGFGAIFLNGEAGAGATATLASSSPNLIVGSPLIVPEGTDNAAFVFHTKGVAADTTATLTASYRGKSISREVHLIPAHEAALLINPSTVTGGHGTTGHVVLKGAAGKGGDTITLGSNNAAADVPFTIKVPQGEDEAYFPIHTHGVSAEVDATITATFDGVSRSALLTIEPAKLAAVFAPDNIVGGFEGIGTVALNGAAGPGGAVVSLDCDSSALFVPPSVKVAHDAWTAPFVFNTRGVDVDRWATITATYGDDSRTTTVVVHPATLAAIHADPTSVVGGKAVRFVVSLLGKAGPGGATVTLGSNNPGVIKVPGNIKIVFGDYGAEFEVTTTAVTKTTVVTVSATYKGVTRSVAVTVQPPPAG